VLKLIENYTALRKTTFITARTRFLNLVKFGPQTPKHWSVFMAKIH